jgi:hypothetical protein
MASYVQVAEYRPSRLSLLVANQGPDAIYLSTMWQDVQSATPGGIVIPANSDRTFAWPLLGEIVWGPWYANCTLSQLRVWEWFSTPQLGDPPYSPGKSPVETVTCGCKERAREVVPVVKKVRAYPTWQLVAFRARIEVRRECRQ